MAKDERLLPLPIGNELQIQPQDIPSGYAPVYEDDPFGEKRSIREYLIVVYKRLWLILTLVTLCTVVTALYMYRLPTMYQSTAQLVIEPRRPKQVGKENVIISNDYYRDLNYLNTQMRLIQSPELMRDVVIKQGLYRDANLLNSQSSSFTGSLKSIFSGNKTSETKSSSLPIINDQNIDFSAENPSLSPEETKRAESYGTALVSGLNVEGVEKTNLVNLKYTHINPDLVVIIPNAVAKMFIEQDANREMEGATQASQDNRKQIEDLQSSIAQLEQERINYMRESNLPLREEKGQDLVAERLQTLSEQWLNAENERRKLQNEYISAQRAIEQGGVSAIPRLNDNESFQTARRNSRERMADMDKREAELNKRVEDIESKITERKAKLSELLAKYTDEHFDVVSVKQHITVLEAEKNRIKKEIEAQLKKENTRITTDTKQLEEKTVKEILSTMRAQVEAAIKNENQLRNSYYTEFAKANEQGQAQVKLTTLTQEIDTNRKLLDGALQRQKELELTTNNARPDNIKLASKAENAFVIGPQRTRNILIAFLISLATGIGLAFLLDYLDDSIRTSDDIGRNLGLPTLAMIPHQMVSNKKNTGFLGAKTESGGSTALVSLQDNRSPIAEAYRHLRTSLLFSSAGKPPQSILVTSSQPSEGKTTTAINTAITLAQAGAEVVIVDCDLRRPRLHHHFNIENLNGLTNYLSGEKNTENLMKSLPQLPNLKIITSGPIPPNPAELLGSNEMKTLLQFLRGNFKHVIVDSPPAISFTDAAILSTLVDGVIIVAMAGKSSIHLIRRFKQRLNNIGARIYGVVLNGIRPNSLEYGYYGYGYSSNYYYSNYAPDENDESTPRMEDSVKTSVHTTKN